MSKYMKKSNPKIDLRQTGVVITDGLRIYTMTSQVFHRLDKLNPDALECITCGEIIRIGNRVIRRRSNGGHIRHYRCAKTVGIVRTLKWLK